MPNWTHMPLIKCNEMLKNVSATAFTVSELLRENQKAGRRGVGGGGKIPLPPTIIFKIFGITLVFMQNSALREKFTFCFSRGFW